MTICQDWMYSMCSASMYIVGSCLIFAPLGPDHPECASDNALTNTAHVFSLGGTSFSVTILSHKRK